MRQSFCAAGAVEERVAIFWFQKLQCVAVRRAKANRKNRQVVKLFWKNKE